MKNESHEEFIRHFTETAADPEKWDRHLQERVQAYIDKFMDSIEEGDIPYAIVALVTVKAALEQQSTKEDLMIFCSRYVVTSSEHRTIATFRKVQSIPEMQCASGVLGRHHGSRKDHSRTF